MTYSANIRFEGELEIGFDDQAAEQWVAATINQARNILIVGMRDGPQTGRLYARANGIVHQASAAGQWPAVDTGNLRRNTRTRVDGLTGEIGSNVPYAEYLQNGTDKMEPRKLYREALDLAIMDREDLLADIIFIRLKTDGTGSGGN